MAVFRNTFCSNSYFTLSGGLQGLAAVMRAEKDSKAWSCVVAIASELRWFVSVSKKSSIIKRHVNVSARVFY